MISKTKLSLFIFDFILKFECGKGNTISGSRLDQSLCNNDKFLTFNTQFLPSQKVLFNCHKIKNLFPESETDFLP
jgi:hypothetical protein